uniref:Uncharacterized protein n=1 Tax=Magallana gigas TaxID=29159 RepID=A0A8W8P035_MAGGI
MLSNGCEEFDVNDEKFKLEGNEDWCWKEDDVAKFVLELEGNGGGRGAVDTGGLSEGTEGVCRKCYRTIETILKTDEKNNDAKQKIKDSVDRVYRTQILSLPSPRRKIITKRLLRSPENVSRPAKSLATVSYVSPVKIAPFRELENKSIKQQCEISSVINIKNENEMIGYHIFC